MPSYILKITAVLAVGNKRCAPQYFIARTIRFGVLNLAKCKKESEEGSKKHLVSESTSKVLQH
jgi:hypothetical protein